MCVCAGARVCTRVRKCTLTAIVRSVVVTGVEGAIMIDVTIRSGMSCI